MTSASPSHLFDQTISTSRPTNTVDEGGSPLETFATYLSDIKASIQPISEAEVIKAGRVATRTNYNLYIEYGNDILATDRIVWGIKTLKVMGPPSNPMSQNRFIKLVCEEIEP